MTQQEIIRLAVISGYYTNCHLKLQNKADGSYMDITVYGYKQNKTNNLMLNGDNISVQVIKDGKPLYDVLKYHPINFGGSTERKIHIRKKLFSLLNKIHNGHFPNVNFNTILFSLRQYQNDFINGFLVKHNKFNFRITEDIGSNNYIIHDFSLRDPDEIWFKDETFLYYYLELMVKSNMIPMVVDAATIKSLPMNIEFRGSGGKISYVSQ